MSPTIKIAGAITLVLSVVVIVAESNHTSVAPAPPDHAYWLSLDRPVYLRAGAVICPEIDLMDAFMQAGNGAALMRVTAPSRNYSCTPAAIAFARKIVVGCACSIRSYPMMGW
jgi:hypothetical protein